MKSKNRSIMAGVLILALVSLACGISIPGGGVDSLGTSVAATVEALAGSADELLTAIPHDLLPTLESMAELPTMPPPAEEAPIRVSFVSPMGDLYTWADGMGAPIMLISGENVSGSYVSPDGTMIAFTKHSDYQFVSLEVINSDGTNRRNLFTAAQADALPRPEFALGTAPGQIAWVPGTNTLSLSLYHFFEGPGNPQSETMYMLDAVTGSFYSLFNTGTSQWYFVWSPDGSKVAVSDSDGIDIYSSSGTKIAGPVLTYPFINSATESAWTARPIWSADNTTLIARVPPEDPFFGPEAEMISTLWRVAADGLSGELILSTPMRYEMGRESGVSPDLTKILYYAPTGLPGEGNFNLMLSNVDGSGSSVYAGGRYENSAVWSPDSAHFFYTVGWLPTGRAFIGQVGVAPVEVLDYNNPVEAKWIDANRYLVVTNNDGRWRLLLGDIGAPTGVIYDSVSTSSNSIGFSVNR